MGQAETFTEKDLSVVQTQTDGAVELVFRGKSNEREPGRFLTPILLNALSLAPPGQSVVLDFSALNYMNSSTFTPVVRFLEQARRNGQQVSVRYREDVKWQSLSFSAQRP